MPEPPQLAPLNVEEQRLYSELLLGDRAPHPISKEAPRHPAAETHFSRLYPGSYSLGHDPKFMTVGEGRRLTGKSRTSPFDSALSSPLSLSPLLRGTTMWGTESSWLWCWACRSGITGWKALSSPPLFGPTIRNLHTYVQPRKSTPDKPAGRYS